MSRLANTIEAILYLKAQPLKISQIAEFAKCDQSSAEEGLIELMGEYAHREGALEIAETNEGYALQLREIYKPLVDTIVPLDIGLGALRTLAAIALRGPITQSDLVELRGSGVYQHVPDLVDQGFVRKRRQADGRSSWLQITEKFYQHFEIDKLPQISDLRLPKPLAGAATDGESEESIDEEFTDEATTDEATTDEVATDEATTDEKIEEEILPDPVEAKADTAEIMEQNISDLDGSARIDEITPIPPDLAETAEA
jgi:segregation and condensation protein B